MTTSTTTKMTKTTKKAVIALLAVSSLVYFSQVTSSVLAYIMMSYPEYSMNTVMLILTVPSIVGVFTAFLVSPLLKRFDARNLLFFSMMSLIVYILILAFWGGKAPFYVLIFAAAILGFKTGMSIPLIQYMIGQFVPPEKRARVISWSYAAISGLTAILNPITGAVAASNGGANWNNAYYVLFIAIPILIFFMLYMPKEPDFEVTEETIKKEMNNDIASSKKNKSHLPGKAIALIVVMGISFFVFMSYGLYMSFYIITENQLGTSVQVGWVASIQMVFGIGAGMSYVFFEKTLKKKLAPFGIGLMLIGIISMTFINTSLAGIIICAITCSVGTGIASPTIVSEIMKVTPTEKVSFAVSLVQATTAASMVATPYLLSFFGGMMGSSLQNKLTVSVIGGIIMMVITVYLFLIKQEDVVDQSALEQDIKI